MKVRPLLLNTGPQIGNVSVGTVYGPDGQIVREEEAQFSGKQKVLAGLVASTAMLLYAFKNGMLNLPRGNNSIQSSQHDEDDEYWE